MERLTERQWKQFGDEGYLRLGEVAPADEIAALQSRIDDIMLGAVVYPGMFFQADSETGKYEDVPSGGWVGPTLAYRKIEQLELDPRFMAYIRKPLFRSIATRVYGPSISIYRAMFMNKPAGRGTVLPYHQDAGDQWRLDRDPRITIWTALDDASRENGCMQVIPGSHKHGLFSSFGHTITAEQEAEFARDEQSVFLDARCGEAILLDNLMLHRSGINVTDRPRRAFSVCYMDGATRPASVEDQRRFPIVFGDAGGEPERAAVAG